MKIATRWAIAAVVAIAAAGPVEAGPFSLFNTGVDAAGVPLAGGLDDPHWSIIAGPGITSPVPAVVATSPNSLYASSSDSRWVWVNASGDGASGTPYTFQLTFDLSGLDPATAVITGAWGVDNVGQILLNGATPEGTGAFDLSPGVIINFGEFHEFRITGGFVSGINRLDFVATDDDNPGALNVNSLVGTVTGSAVPEPGGLALFGVGAFGYLISCCALRVRHKPRRAARS